MSVYGVADKTVEILVTGKYPFVVLNLANPDMVGHTGIYAAAVEAVGHCDRAIGIIYQACKKLGYILFVTSDHGYPHKVPELIIEMPKRCLLITECLLILLTLYSHLLSELI